MKKALFLVLAIVMCLSLFACGDGSANTPTTPDNPTNPTTAEPTDPPHTHDWKAATCTEPKTCKTCGQTEGSAAKHSWKAATCTEPKTCKTCGQTEGSVAEHSWKAATCTEPKTCTNCGQTEGSVAEHSWKAATCTEPKTCKNCGQTEGSVAEHSWKDATCTEPKTCKNCKATEGSANGHNWKAATCTAPKICKVCSKTEGSVKAHSYSSGKCTVCNAKDPNYQDPRCYKGTSVLTVTESTGAKCSGSWTKYLDLHPVSENYVAGCQRYSYEFHKQYTPYAVEEYEQYFKPYIEYLKGLGLNCYSSSMALGGFADEAYYYAMPDGRTFIVTWNISSYSNYSWIGIMLY